MAGRIAALAIFLLCASCSAQDAIPTPTLSTSLPEAFTQDDVSPPVGDIHEYIRHYAEKCTAPRGYCTVDVFRPVCTTDSPALGSFNISFWNICYAYCYKAFNPSARILVNCTDDIISSKTCEMMPELATSSTSAPGSASKTESAPGSSDAQVSSTPEIVVDVFVDPTVATSNDMESKSRSTLSNSQIYVIVFVICGVAIIWAIMYRQRKQAREADYTVDDITRQKDMPYTSTTHKPVSWARASADYQYSDTIAALPANAQREVSTPVRLEPVAAMSRRTEHMTDDVFVAPSREMGPREALACNSADRSVIVSYVEDIGSDPLPTSLASPHSEQLPGGVSKSGSLSYSMI